MSLPKKIALVLGTRPEIIKLSPIIRLLEKKNRDYFVIHTGQHYSYEMDRLFFKELGLREPKYRLKIRSKGVTLQADHTGRMLIEVERILLAERPGFVLVQGDTNSVLAGALTVSKLLTTRDYTHIDMRICHVEAGLRSYDRNMPEEINRFITDHLSNFCFAPTAQGKKLLIGEGVPKNRIFVTGNTIVDAVQENVRRAVRPDCLKKLGLDDRGFFLLTLHRQENVDHRERLRRILEGVARVQKRFGLPVLFPIHPRTVKKLDFFRLRLPEKTYAVDPLGFLEFLYVESRARLILSDSGGVQEEACILKVPCVTLRTTTERPETVQVGANVLGGHDPLKIDHAAQKMMKRCALWRNPFGDGRSAERILKILTEAAS